MSVDSSPKPTPPLPIRAGAASTPPDSPPFPAARAPSPPAPATPVSVPSPAPSESPRRSPRDSSVESLLALLHSRRRGLLLDATEQHAVRLTEAQYHTLHKSIAKDKALKAWVDDQGRYDWIPDSGGAGGTFVLRMPSPKHDSFARSVDIYIQRQIDKIRTKERPGIVDEIREAVKRIHGTGTSDARLGDTAKVSADAAYTVEGRARPLVVIEVAYSQNISAIKDSKAPLCIRHGSNVVVAFDLHYEKPADRRNAAAPSASSAAYTIYRADRFEENGVAKVAMEAAVEDVDFLANHAGALQLSLSDFFPENQVPMGAADVHIEIPHLSLEGFLSTAEAQQQTYDANAASPIREFVGSRKRRASLDQQLHNSSFESEPPEDNPTAPGDNTAEAGDSQSSYAPSIGVAGPTKRAKHHADDEAEDS